jgi:hypothetical protein
LLLALAVGVGLATLPHWRTGNAAWIADYDELAFYLPMGAASYRAHPWRLSDPATGGPTFYQALSIVPGILIARGLELDPWHLGLCWRVLGGVAVAAAWYLLLRCRFRPAGAATAACLLLADPGVLHGQPVYVLLKALMHPLPLDGTPTSASLPQWRILDPVLCWPWWLAFLALVARAAAVQNRWRVLAAGVAFGILFHVYFYLWTAAFVGLLLAILVDRGRWRVYLPVIGIGIVVGLPALIASAQFRIEHGSEWLLRMDKFLPVGRFDELLIPRVSIALLAAGWFWALRRGRDWLWLVAIATAALLLLNQTMLTGFQLENFHWNFALGPALSLLVVLAVADLCERLPLRVARMGRLLGAGLAAFTVVAGGWLYARAAVALPENIHIQHAATSFRAQTAGLMLSDSGAVAGDPDFQYLAAVGFGLRPLAGYSAVLSPISDAELDMRVALNAHLLGWSRDRFRADQDAALRVAKWGREARSAEAREARLAARMAAWDRVAADVTGATARFDVGVLARLASAAEPPPTGWVRVQSGSGWAVWSRPRGGGKD